MGDKADVASSLSELDHVANNCKEGFQGQILMCIISAVEWPIDWFIGFFLINWMSFVLHLSVLAALEAARAFKTNPKVADLLSRMYPRALRHWILCVCVLNIFYLTALHAAHPFMTSLDFVLFDTAVFLLVGRYTGDTDEGSSFSLKKNESKVSKTTCRAHLFSHPLEESLLFFVTQSCLMVFFVSFMNDNTSVKGLGENAEINLARWFLGYLLTVTACKSKAGKGYDQSLWSDVWSRVPNFPPKMDAARWISSANSLRIRQCFDVLTNGFFYQAILTTVPVLVVTTQPNKFIGTLVGFMFVVKLDDAPSIPVDVEIDAWTEQNLAAAEPDRAEQGAAGAQLIDSEGKSH